MAIKKVGIQGEGEQEYVVKSYAIVEITSHPIQADNSIEAFRLAHQKTDFEKLLRDAMGNEIVSSVQFSERFEKVLVHKSLEGYELEEAAKLEGSILEELLKTIPRKP